jgi:hypothetical protein
MEYAEMPGADRSSLTRVDARRPVVTAVSRAEKDNPSYDFPVYTPFLDV